MEINWLKYSPTENMTALVTTAVPVFRRTEVGAAIMNADPEIEQVGFIQKAHWPESRIRIEMAGGEFCGNAAMCAAVYSISAQLQPGMSSMFPIESTGASDFVVCMVRINSGHSIGTVDLPLPTGIDTALLSFHGKSYQMPLVRFPGITHAILPADAMDHASAEEAIREWTRIEGADALGLIFFNSATSYIEPLVYVPAANTLCWERGCASGSAALGAFLASLAGAGVVTDVRQPGGIIKVRADWGGGRLIRISVSGRVEALGSHTTAV